MPGGGGHRRIPDPHPDRQPDRLGRAEPDSAGRIGRHVLVLATLAAAFAAFLAARTRPSDSSSTTSATEIRLPAAPNAPAASRQPGGCTPYCFPSRATKMAAFCAPNPGKAAIRFRSSTPEGTSVHRLTASPPYDSTRTRHTPWTRPAIEPGKRCTAGGLEHSAASYYGSAAERAATSSCPPIRSAITAGPENAFSMGTCWSSTIPISRALPSEASNASALSSPVRYIRVALMAASLAYRPGCALRQQ